MVKEKVKRIFEYKLKPGSYEAILKGCTCPLLPNMFPNVDKDGNTEYLVNTVCPIHGDSK